MTSRERLLTVLRGGIPDRVPVSPFVQEEYLSEAFPERSAVDRVVDAAELAEKLDFDLIAKHSKFAVPHFLKKSFPGWKLSKSASESGGILTTRIEIETPARTLLHEEVKPAGGKASAGVHASVRKHLLASGEDLKVFIDCMPAVDQETIDEMHQTAEKWRKVISDRGILAPWGWAGAYNVAGELRGIETLMLDPYDDEELYVAFMSRLTEQMEIYNRNLASTAVDCVGIQGHMANSRTVSPDYYRTYVMSYEKRVIDAVHAGGACTIFHNCGFASTLYDLYREMGMTVWETVSAAPQGDNDLANAKRILGDKMVLLGNLDQVSFLKTASSEEVAEATRRMVQIGKPGGRYIFSTSDFLEKGTPEANVRSMIEAAREAGRYGSKEPDGQAVLK